MKDISTGEIGTLVSAYDWSQTPLGAAQTWSAELQAAVEILVTEIDRAKTSCEHPHPSLFKAQQRHDTLLNEMDKGFVIFEMLFDSELKPVDYRYLETNSLFEPITGLKDVIGKTALEIMPDIEPFWIETYGKVVLTGESVLIEHEVKAMKSWFEVKAFPIDAPQEFRFGVLFTDITARKLAQERVELIQERLEISLAAGDVGVWDLDLVSKQAWRSIEHDRIFGYDLLLPEWNYAMFLSHVIPRDREWVNAGFETAIANHTNWDIECCIQRIDGETSWIWARAASEYNDKGEPVRMYGVVKDVSDRKRQELNNKFLDEIQKDLVILSDPTEIMSVVGEKIRCFFSFSILSFVDINTATNEAKVVYNNRDADILDAVSTHSLGDYLSEIHLGKLKAGQTITIDDVTTDPESKDGGAAYEIYQVRSVIHSPHLSNGQWKFMLGGHRREPSNWRADEVELIDELTARLYLRISRTRAEQALSESEARFRNMADIAPVLIWMSGTDKLCNYFNQPWLDYAGRTLEQEMGNGWAEGVYADDFQFCLDTYFTAFDARESFQMEYRFRRFDGQYRWFVDKAHPRFTPEGEFLGYIGSCLDIEDLKRRELNSNFLAEIQKDLAVIEHMDQIMNVVGEKIRLWFDSSIVAFADVDVPADEIRVIYASNDHDIPNAVGIHRLSEYYGEIHLQQLKAGQKVAISDVRAEPNIKDNGIAYESWQILSSVVIPCKSDSQLKFLMGVHRRMPSVWREDELELMGELILRIHIEIERIRSEAALEKLNQRFEAAMQAVDGIIFEWSMDTNFVFRSQGLFNLIGVEAEDAPPTWDWWFNLIHPEDQPNIESFFAQSESNKDRYQFEYRVRHADGRWINVWEKGSLKRNDAGEIVQIVGFTSDTSDRKRAEEALQHSEEFMNRVLESSSDCIKVLDLNAQLLYMSIGGMGLLEIDDLTPYLNSEWLYFWKSEHRQAAEAAFTVAKSGEIGKFQGFCATVKGNPKWWDVAVTPIRDGAGKVVQILSTSRDITEQKHAEEELRQMNAILDVINKCVPTPIFVKDRQGRIIYANPATLTALGKTAAEVIGRYDSDLYSSPEDAVRVMENDHRIMSSGQMEAVEESADGINIFLVMKAPYYNEAGEVIGLVGISYDITDRVQIERDRERILQQKQAALEESERVNRIKDEFLAMLSHELRSPLNPILGWTKMLQTRKLDETKTIAALATIERNARVQCQLIDDLLDMARVLRGKLTLNAAPVSLSEVIESAIDTVQTAAIAKSIQINPVILDIVQVSGDEVRLQQIVWNLLTNAVKFTPIGGCIDILLEQIDNEAQITIIDTGKGISSDFLPYIFESFRQEDASVTRKHGGLGLGMAIVYQLVEAHGGKVTANSLGEGKGATFTVRLPLLNANSAENRSIPLKDQPLDLNGIRVLAIDDNPDNLELIAIMLTQAGAEVQSVASAAKFLIALKSFRPDVVVSDIAMPEIDGFTLLRQVRSLSPEQGGQVPAIAVTAYAGEIDRQQAIAAGFQKHIAKPLEPEQLVGAIVSLLNRR